MAPPKIKRMLAIGLKLESKECLHFLKFFSDRNSPRQGASAAVPSPRNADLHASHAGSAT